MNPIALAIDGAVKRLGPILKMLNTRAAIAKPDNSVRASEELERGKAALKNCTAARPIGESEGAEEKDGRARII
jgi:hypothetical protein